MYKQFFTGTSLTPHPFGISKLLLLINLHFRKLGAFTSLNFPTHGDVIIFIALSLVNNACQF